MESEADRKQVLEAGATAPFAPLVAYIKHLFSNNETTAETESLAPRPAASSPSCPDADKALAEFQRGIKEILAGNAARLKGAVHVIGLASVRAHYGARWPENAEKVHRVVEDCIRRRLVPSDLCAPYKDEGYIIVFSTLRDEAAKLKCGLIAQEITKRLFGSSASEKLDMAAVEISAVGEVALASFAVEHIADRIHADAETAAWTTEVASTADDSPGAATSSGWAAPAAPSLIGGHRTAAPERAALQFVYRPMWQVRRKVISAFICVPARVSAEGQMWIGGAAMPLGYASPQNAVLDIRTLQRVLKDYERLLADGKNSILVVPVHYITLSDNRLLAPYAEACNRIPQSARGLLIFELIGLPDNLPTGTIIHALTRLRPFSRAVLVRRRFDSADHAKLKGLGVYGVGLEIGTLKDPESEVIAGMEQFNEDARAAGLSTYVHGLRSLSLISAAAGAGFKFIDGDPIMSILDTPQSVAPFDLQSLYGPLLAGDD